MGIREPIFGFGAWQNYINTDMFKVQRQVRIYIIPKFTAFLIYRGTHALLRIEVRLVL
jgi:hypothetical protein